MDRYLGRRISSTLLKTLVAFVLLYVLIDWSTTQQRAVEKYNVPWSIVFEYYASQIPTFIFKFQATALALLVATLFVLGKAAQDSEITALLAGGVSMTRVARTPVLIALTLSLGVFVFENTLGVNRAAIASQIEREYFKRALQNFEQGPSWTGLGPENWSCHILHFNRVALTGTNVFIHAFNESSMQEIRARRIYWEPDTHQWILEDGRWSTVRRNPSLNKAEATAQDPAPFPETPDMNTERITQIPAPFPETPDMLFALEEAPETKTVGEMRADLKNATLMGVPTARARVAYHSKFSRPALCFVIVWLAIPFALRVRRGGIFISFGISIALGLAYVTLYAIALGLGGLGLLPPIVAAWLANVVFLAAGVMIFRQMRV